MNDETPNVRYPNAIRHSSFVISSSFVIRHSSFRSCLLTLLSLK
jgi:hypothetical protein